MTRRTPLASAHQCGHRSLRALRAFSPSALVALTLALVLGGAGLASAANGGTFILGRANSETATAHLSNSRGTALSLTAPVGRAPLAVNRSALVKNLNAQYTGGLTAAQLRATGGDGFTLPGTNTPIDSKGEVVVSTGPLPAGVYYVTATALLVVQAGDVGGFCHIVKKSAPGTAVSGLGGARQEGYVQAAETTAVAINSGDTLGELCEVGGADVSGSVTYDGGITAIRILSSSGTRPARAGRPIGTALPGPVSSRP
jgi:hypothetical protein